MDDARPTRYSWTSGHTRTRRPQNSTAHTKASLARQGSRVCPAHAEPSPPAERGRLLDSLVDAVTKLLALLAKDVALDVGVAEHAVWVDVFEHADKVVEARVELAQSLGPKGMRLCPVRLAAMPDEDLLESREELPVGNVEPIRPIVGWRGESRSQVKGDEEKRKWQFDGKMRFDQGGSGPRANGKHRGVSARRIPNNMWQ